MFVAKATAWIVAQSHSARDAILWICQQPSKIISWIVQASTDILHLLCMIVVTTANFLVLLVGAIVGIFVILLVLTALHNTFTWTRVCLSTSLHKTRSVLLLHPSTHERRRILIPVNQPRYGTMDSNPTGTAVSRTTIEQSRGPGWRRFILQSTIRYADGRTGNADSESIGNVVETEEGRSGVHLPG
jgi:hypothetical protein